MSGGCDLDKSKADADENIGMKSNSINMKIIQEEQQEENGSSAEVVMEKAFGGVRNSSISKPDLEIEYKQIKAASETSNKGSIS